MKIKELYYASIGEWVQAKKANDFVTMNQAESLVALIDELVFRQYCTLEDDSQKITELHHKLDMNKEAHHRTEKALAKRVRSNREGKFKQ